jgi:hypothetical protein
MRTGLWAFIAQVSLQSIFTSLGQGKKAGGLMILLGRDDSFSPCVADTVGEFPATFVRVVVPLPVVDRADPDTPGESHSGKPAKPAIPSRPAVRG